MYNLVLIKYKNSYQIRRYNFPVKCKVDLPFNDSNNYFELLEEEVNSAYEENFCGFDTRSDYVSVNHSKQFIYYYSRSVDWSDGFFVTLTFNPDIVDSFDYSSCVKKLRIFLDSLKRYDNSIKYLFVPELHSSGRFHFHGLITKTNFIRDDVVFDSGHYILGDKIYNFKKFWKYGFSTLSKIKNSAAVEKYIAKYTTKKLLNNTKYQHRYFVSQNISQASILKYDYPYDDIIQRLYEYDLIQYMNTDGNYNRVTFAECKPDDLILDLLKDFKIKS